ncbi:MAG: pirin family protein [Bacteroidota bacterium]
MDSTITHVLPLSFPWQTQDPFLFCVHHLDFYPEGNADFAPDPKLLKGRPLGSDFDNKQKWRMYHGQTVSGFPHHPHRGFETVTVAKRGVIDHADSLGAAGRFRDGDVQWMTAGKGVLHSEMFPLLEQDKENTLELFQIWLNLPQKNKLVEPHFRMLWSEEIPEITEGAATLRIMAGAYGEVKAPHPTPNSWAADPENHVNIWTIRLKANSSWTLPPAIAGLSRSLYFYEGNTLQAAGRDIRPYHVMHLRSDASLELTSGEEGCSFLLLQGRPIGEPVAQHGPFVMNTREEIQQAFIDYQQTQFGGWPWEQNDPVHQTEHRRFARHADGKEGVKG